jgi:dihydrolipoamide dehydrogenase
MAEIKKHDIAIIGAGPGGYVAAIRAAQLGQSVALIDKDLLGGCCLNVGCIPTKTLLSNAEIAHSIQQAAKFGISTGAVSFDYAQMKARKDSVVSKIRASLEGLLKTNKIAIYRGTAQFESPTSLKVTGQDNLFIEAPQIIIASGSVPLDLPAFACDHERILNSTSMLEIERLPKHLCIVGGGYIGCEFASLYADLGVTVTILEAAPTILAAQGSQIAQFMTKAFRSRGIEMRVSVKVQQIINKKTHVTITLQDNQTLDADLALIAIGRQIYTGGLHLHKAGLSVNAKGAIETDTRMQTAVKGIYAIGDVTGQWMLAHVASHQGLIAASNAAGREMHMQYNAIPAVVFTRPEVATVGMTVEQAAAAGFSATAGFFPFQALGKAAAAQETDGFAQIVIDQKTGQILGAQVIGSGASNLIAEMALAIQNELLVESVVETIHAHPTMAECWLEAAAIANNTPINFPAKTINSDAKLR